MLSQAQSAAGVRGLAAPSELLEELWRHKQAYGTVAKYALVSGVIASASWLYTMQVYDRVVTTRS